MYKIGDKVTCVDPFLSIHGKHGTIKDIDASTVFVLYEVEFGTNSSYMLIASQIEHQLPVGYQPTVEQELYSMIQESKVVCDCGGFKTFQSMSPENHSHWCSSRNITKST